MNNENIGLSQNPVSLSEYISAGFATGIGINNPAKPSPFLVAGYESLADVLVRAYSQAAVGKGKERHANGKPFDRQPIMELSRLYGPGFAAGQAAKKTQEALGMLSRGETAAALAELHGAIVYVAATAALVRESAK